MQWLVFALLLRELLKDDCTSTAFDLFLHRSHLLQCVMTSHLLVGVSYQWTWRSLLHLLQIYGMFMITWVFILWSCNAYTFTTVGVPLHVTTENTFLLKDLLVASILSMVSIKATVQRTMVHFSRVGVGAVQKAQTETAAGTESGAVLGNGTSHWVDWVTPLISYLPEASVSFFLIALSSSVYLLDWHENWQLWPVPTIIGAFVCATVEDLLSLVKAVRGNGD